MVLKSWADVKYHVPTGFGFSPKASGFYPFGDATALAGEGGVGDVVWLIQASASNHKPKGRFFWFVYAKGIPKEPSLWFATTSNSRIMAKSHPAGMQICYATFAGISLRLCSISLRSFRITFAAYLPTHI
ncbi:MAG: hypothetical protein SPG73_04605 [Sodaliphilus sp.]|nr:hypothetical protein [Sodaliphilus sp.]